MEGLHYKQIAEREHLMELAINLRYTLNASKVNANKLKLDREKLKIKRLFRNDQHIETIEESLMARVEALNEHFRNR